MDSRKWWKEAVVYQCYWRSFYDSNGDGIGDLRGLLQKLDHIKELGADIIWLNPCYASPDKDNGYDIADYCSIMPKAGTMENFDELLWEVHQRGMRLVMDLVVNHTSDQHKWFVESRSSRDNPKRDWYIWHDAVDGKTPNNYKAYFSPSAWEYDQKTGQYYFHSFAVEQPDLNWKNPALRQAVYKIMHFWLSKGVDGFRMDVINMLSKKAGFPNAQNPEILDYMSNNPGIHEYLQEMHKEVLSQYDIVTVGECPWTAPKEGVLFAGFERNELNTLFNFEVSQEMPIVDWRKFRDIQMKWHRAFYGKAWNSQYLSNHDVPRQVSKYADDRKYRVPAAKMLATLLHMLPGMPYIYQGEEIGMTNVKFGSIEDYDDIWMKHMYQEIVTAIETKPRAAVAEWLGQYVKREQLVSASNEELKEITFSVLCDITRDNSRTPMQWSNSQNAGFSKTEPWLKINPNFSVINVEQDRSSENSIYHYYQKLIALRKRMKEVIVYGDYSEVDCGDERIYAFKRFCANDSLVVVLNVSDQEVPIAHELVQGEVFLKNYNKAYQKGILRPYEALILAGGIVE